MLQHVTHFSSECLHGPNYCLNGSTHCVHHSSSINGIFSVFSNKNEKHGSTIEALHNVRTVKSPAMVIFENTKNMVAGLLRIPRWSNLCMISFKETSIDIQYLSRYLIFKHSLLINYKKPLAKKTHVIYFYCVCWWHSSHGIILIL